MKFDKNLERELRVERERWNCPEYHGIIYTSKSKWDWVVSYVNNFDDTHYNVQRKVLQLSGGGTIRFCNLKTKPVIL